MRRINRIGLAFGMLAALGLASGSASAQNLELSELAAAVALPVITGGQAPNAIKATQGDVIVFDESAISLLTITNGRGSATTLKIDVISGDQNVPFVGGDQWQSDSFDCLLTGRETITFLVVPAGTGSILYGECSNPLANDGPFANNVIFAVGAQNGILFAAAGDPVPPGNISPAIGQDILFADAVVVDIALGQAYSVAAIAFQAGAGANNGDKVYKFDGQEYSQWPSSLATNFISPDPGILAGIATELILFTLDGATSAAAPPRVSMSGLGWDDDENSFNWSHEFDCFDVVSLEDITLNFTQPFLGSLSGHLTLTPQPIGSGVSDSHDDQFGDGNNSRRRPVHGWIVQSVIPGALVVKPGQPTVIQPAAFPVPGFVAWARPLNQNRFAIAPFLADQPPVLDAESSNP